MPLEHAAAEEIMDLFMSLMDAGADGVPGWRGCHPAERTNERLEFRGTLLD